MILYWVVSKEAIELIHGDNVDLQIPFNFCECINKNWSSAEQNITSTYDKQCDGAKLDDDGNLTIAANLECDAVYPLTIFIVLGSVLLAFFVQYDYTAAFKVWCFEECWWNKVFAGVVLSESVYALYCGSLFALQGVESGNQFNTIMNCVGILFIHDIDEKLYETIELLDKQEFKDRNICQCANGFFVKWLGLIFTIVFILFVILFGQMVVLYIAPQYLMIYKRADFDAGWPEAFHGSQL